MDTSDLEDKLYEVESKLDCISWIEMERGKGSQYGYWLILSDIVDQIKQIRECVVELRDSPTKEFSELFVTNK